MKDKFQVTFLPMKKTVDVDLKSAPFGHTGESGSILDIAMGVAGIDIDHACGGVAACATCHVIVEEGLESCPPPQDNELDMLDNAPGNTLKSRLACQAVPSGEVNLVVKIPDWNRNLVKE